MVVTFPYLTFVFVKMINDGAIYVLSRKKNYQNVNVHFHESVQDNVKIIVYGSIFIPKTYQCLSNFSWKELECPKK